VRALLRSEWLKQRTTRTNLGLLAGMLGLVVAAVILHGLLPAEQLSEKRTQLMVMGRGEFIGALFAALLGAISFTGEIRHGTIRPTLLVSTRRARVIAAKVAVSILVGAAFGLLAGASAAAVGTAVFGARGIDVLLDGGDYALLVVGAAAASALWAAIGVGVGALFRNQVPTLIAITTWLLFVEGLLVGDLVGIGDIQRFLPGAAAAAISGQQPEQSSFLAPAAAVVLLAVYAVASTVAGTVSTVRRDVP
jgi:ABC-2 type transport system permease protein